MNYKDIDEMPPGMRKLYEAQMAKKQESETRKRLEQLMASGGEKPKANKYHNTPTERLLPNGNVIKFDSKKEAAYYDRLMVLKSAGQVRDIRLQVQFLIQPAYTVGETGERIRAINYLADFTYESLEPDGTWKKHVADSKGRRTKDFILKEKLLADSGIYIEEV